MKRVAIIEGDVNDGDYITREEEVTDKEISLLKKIASALTNLPLKFNHNWAISRYCDEKENPKIMYKDILTEDDIDRFNENFCPHG